MGDSHCPEGGAGGGGPLGGRRSSSPPADCHHLVDSSNPPSAGGDACGELNHVGWLAEHIGRLCLQPDYSDVTLVVEDVRLPAHRLVLACCSSYFRSAPRPALSSPRAAPASACRGHEHELLRVQLCRWGQFFHRLQTNIEDIEENG